MEAVPTAPTPFFFRPLPFWAGVTGLLAVSAVALAATGSLAVALAPCVLIALFVALLKVPLGTCVVLLAFFALTLENPAERPAAGHWQSPLYTVGALLMANLNITLPIRALRFSGMDAVLGLLIARLFYERIRRGKVTEAGAYETPRVLGVMAILSLFAVVGMMAYGKLRGGDVTQMLWQGQKLVYLPLVFLLFQAATRSRKDWSLVAKGLVAAAMLRSVLAVFVRMKFPDSEAVPYATTHGDSILFGSATALILVTMIERPGSRSWMLGLFTLPVLVAGMIANSRRLVWVEIALCLLFVLAIGHTGKVKRALLRFAVVMTPIFALYVAAGWNSHSRIFVVAQAVKGVVSAEADRSTLSREVENWNLAYTLGQFPLLGQGLGHEYIEVIVGDDISHVFPQYRYIPHNSVLGMWAFGGVVGITCMWLVLSVAVFFAARAYRFAERADDRIAALTVICCILIYLLQAYGDMGVVSWTSVFVAAPALAIAGKLARATGAWPSRAPAAAGGVA